MQHLTIRGLTFLCPLVVVGIAGVLFVPRDRTTRRTSSPNQIRLASANSPGKIVELQIDNTCDASHETAGVATEAVVQVGYDEQKIRSVQVPIFKSGSKRRFVDYQLTEAIMKQIQQRSSFRLTGESEAETRLAGRIIDVPKSAMGMTKLSDARELPANLLVEFRWEDLRTGKIIVQQRVPLPEEIQQWAGKAGPTSEAGQSLATTDQIVIDRLARRVVDMMETPW